MTTWAQPLQAPAGWLRGVRFDRFFIIGIAGIGLGTGLVITLEPRLFAPVLFVDVWLLWYHHVVSTFTRLCFDARSFRDHRFLNTSRFRRGVDPDSRFLSTLSQDRNLWVYLGVCAGLSSIAYWVIGSLTAALVAPIIIFQAISFHHYIVDGVIWKVRRKATQQTLGIAT